MLFTSWISKIGSSKTNSLLSGLALRHLALVEDEREREHLSASITSNDVSSLCNYSPPYDKLSPSDSYHLRQVTAFFGKRDDVDLGTDRRDAAIRTFIETEELCRKTNEIFKKRARGEFLFSPRVESILFRAQRKVAFILGDLPEISALKLRFGPGATTQVSKRTASPRAKLGQEYACSEDFADILKDVLEEMPSWLPEGDLDVVRVPVQIHDGRLVFVPKTAKTDRSIVIEPSLNQMVQLGIGEHIARRLCRVGIDIRDQRPNQVAAREGSLTGALATLDLSSASDTISTELVHELLPVDWFLFLNRARTSHVEFEGYRFVLEKFSANGNGFTFPLETLLFYAIVCASVEEDDESKVLAYGDDLIVPSKYFDEVCNTLHCLGFLVNRKKSFGSGPFRESCGKDYHSGVDIRPCYIKTALSCKDLFRLYNYYSRRGLEEFALHVLELIPKHLVLWGPDGYGDGHLIGGPPPRPKGRDKGWGGYVFDTYTLRSVKSFKTYKNDRVFPCYSIYLQESIPWWEPSIAKIPLSGDLDKVLDRALLEYHKDGNWGLSVPGSKGYKRISIYTFER